MIIRDKFSVFGTLQKITVLPKLESAFVTFEKREDAESAVTDLFKNLKIHGTALSLGWGSAQNALPPPPSSSPVSLPGFTMIAPPPPSALPKLTTPSSVPTADNSGNIFAMMGQYYPSMNPNALGSKGDTVSTEDENKE